MSESPMIKAALAYADKGFKIIPLHSTFDDGSCTCGKTVCSSVGKHPRTQHGVKDASTDPNIIEEWWRRHPNANIGIATGQGTIAIDIDVKNGAKGKESLLELEQKFGKLPETLMAHTPTGGQHLLFKTDTKIGNKVGVLPAIDIRSDGGYIVASPSTINGKPYQWEDESVAITTLPAPVAHLLQKGNYKDTSQRKQEKLSALSGVHEGFRNDTIFRYACDLRARDISCEEAMILIQASAKECSPPLGNDEAIRCLDSAYGRNDPSSFYNLTELGNAERFAEAYKDCVRYVPDFGFWLFYNGQRWVPSNHGEIESLAKKVVRSISDEAEQCTDESLSKAIGKHAKVSERRSSINNMLELARSEGLSVPSSSFDNDDNLFGVQNGVIDLSDGSYRKSIADDFISTTSGVKFVRRKGCKRWHKFILEIMDNDKQVADFLQRLVGYTLLGGNPEQIIIIFYGHGANGKTTFINILNMLLGSYSKNVDASSYMLRKYSNPSGPDEATVRLKGARATFTTEIAEGQILNEDLVKKITGGDTLVGRIPYARASIEFTPKFTPFMATNHKPIIQGDDHAIWRRILLVPFNCTFEGDKRDKLLSTVLENELPGILNWAIDGCMKYQKNGLNVPKSVSDATKEYRTEMDLLIDWLDEYCSTNEKYSESSASLFISYEFWCEANECNKYFDHRVFGRKLSDRGFVSAKIKGVRCFYGIALNESLAKPSHIRTV